jgi:arylsulfatase A-like enzyme
LTVSHVQAAGRPAWAAALVLILGLTVVPGPTIGFTAAAAEAGAGKPNMILIMTDDEDVAIHEFMPKTRALIEEQGVTFANFFVSYPLCCPARASILRGQYAHNTGLVGNEPPLGGYETFHELGLEQSTLATWLTAAGYRTAMVGKYLNRYVPHLHGVPPGWQDWYVGGNAHVSYDYRLNENGRIVHYGDRPEDYLNDVLTAKAVDVIRQAAVADEPFFLYVLPYTPHSPSVPAPRHEGLFADAVLPRPPSFNEAVVSDKPAFVRGLPPLDGREISRLEAEYRLRLASLQAIDDMVEAIVNALTATRQLGETYIIYSSDNGFHLGEHRLPAGKDFPYEEDIRVPAVMRGPGVPKGLRVDALVLNTDLAPTLAAIAGAVPPDFVDGQSFLPLLQDPHAPWRDNFLIERRQFEAQYTSLGKRLGMSEEALQRGARFDGLRTASWSYVEYGTGERELYDLRADPFQLVNLAETADPRVLAELSAHLAKLVSCAGAACRELEDLPLSIDVRPIAKAEPPPEAAPVVQE